MTRYSMWIYDRNLRPAMEGLAFVCSYSFDDSDWIAIEHGLKNAKASKDIWFDYPLIGEFRIDTFITSEIGSFHYILQITSEKQIMQQIYLIEFYAQSNF